MRSQHATLRGLLAVVCCAMMSAKAHGQCETSKFIASNASPGFGYPLSVSGDRLAVGSPQGTYIFVKSETGWIEEALIQPEGVMGNFQNSLHGDRLLLGWAGDDQAGTDAGAVFVFLRQGSNWVQEAKLMASNAVADGFFGEAVSLHGNVAVVGNPIRGLVYAFRYNGSSWDEETVFPQDDGFGHRVATDGQSIVVADRGYPWRIVFYTWSGGSWVYQGENDDHRQMDAVAVSGNVAVGGGDADFGHHGQVVVFHRSGGTWNQHSVLTPSDNPNFDNFFGRSVSLIEDRILVGAPITDAFADYCTDWAGSAYLFQFDGLQWIEEARLIPSDPDYEDRFGLSVGIGNGFYAISAGSDDGFGEDFGALYEFAEAVSDCNANKIEDSCELYYLAGIDCNNNGRPDDCDIADGISEDCSGDGRPDECEPDCNGNSIADPCDIDSTVSADCNKNKIPDECELPFECIEMDACLVYTTPATSAPYMGTDVAIDGDWAVVTSAPDFDNNRMGIHSIYTREGTSWVLQANVGLTGYRAAISGDTAVLSGGVYRRNGSTWAFEASLPAGPFAIDGDTLILHDALPPGQPAEVYRRSGATWSLEATLTPEPNVSQQFGWDVDIDGDLAIVGAIGYPN